MKSKKPIKRCRSRITRAARKTMKFHISPAFKELGKETYPATSSLSFR